MNELNHFIKVDFHNFKAFERFTLHLRHFNILVGPNNSGKSTILAAFRILAAALRKANARKPELVPTPQGRSYGYNIDLKDVSVAEENMFYNYDDTIPASVKFKLSNKNELQLYFTEANSCYLISDTQSGQPRTPSTFRKQFNCPIGFVPILGPVEHNEARKLSYSLVASRSEFAVIPIEGFNPERARSLIKGIETTLGGQIATAIILDRDFRSQPECDFIQKKCGEFCDLVRIHSCKEIENFLLIPQVIDRAAARRVAERITHGGKKQAYMPSAQAILDKFAEEKKTYVTSQFLAFRRRFQRSECPSIEEASANEETLDEFEKRWTVQNMNFLMMPGKDALSRFNEQVQKEYGITVTATAIIDNMKKTEVPAEMESLIELLDEFTRKQPQK